MLRDLGGGDQRLEDDPRLAAVNQRVGLVAEMGLAAGTTLVNQSADENYMPDVGNHVVFIGALV